MFFSKALKLFVLLTTVVLSSILPAVAQQGTGLRGLVTDPTGAVIPDATITLTAATGEKSTPSLARMVTMCFAVWLPVCTS